MLLLTSAFSGKIVSMYLHEKYMVFVLYNDHYKKELTCDVDHIYHLVIDR